MENKIFSTISNVLGRDLIRKHEGKLTYVQLFGFGLIVFGLTYFASFLLPSGIVRLFAFLELAESLEASKVAISFFTTMLGIAFAFPDMLKGQTKEISTMRIVVFMFASVICMLLLKIGWDKQSMSEIGLDAYWMGVIAFLFGAKATQSYFENARNIIEPLKEATDEEEELTNAEISKLALMQHRDELLLRYPNIASVSDTLKDGNSCLTIYVKDNHLTGLPSNVSVLLKNGSTVFVPTEIVGSVGIAKPHIGQLTDEVSDSESKNYLGSICCLVSKSDKPGLVYLVTAGHIFTKGEYLNYGTWLGSNRQRSAYISGFENSKIVFQVMSDAHDIAIAEVIDPTDVMKNYVLLNKGFYNVSSMDYNPESPNVTILSKENRERKAFILDSNVSTFVDYGNRLMNMRNLILLGSTNDRNSSQSVTKGGDSGSCVIHADGTIVGIILGGDDKFSFALPIESILNRFNFKPI